MKSVLQIMLVDDHDIVRSGLRRLIDQNDDMKVVAEAADGEQAYKIFADTLPDILVMDISMPGMGGLEMLNRIRSRFPAARIVIFSMHENVAFANQALSIGARAYVAKAGMSNEVLIAIREVAAGRCYINPAMAQKIALQSLTGGNDVLGQLSPREFEVFRLLAEGNGVDEIARLLKISQKTAANYQTVLKHKLGISSPVDLVRLAIRQGLIES